MADGRTRPRRIWPVWVAATAIVVVVASAWLLQGSVSGGGESPKGDSPSAYSIAVKKGGELLKTYDLAALHALPQSNVVIDGKEQSGPLLSALLADAGASDYRTITVRGAGVRDDGSLTLSAAQVSAGVQLDYADRGTVKVCAPALDRSEWVRDVVTIIAD